MRKSLILLLFLLTVWFFTSCNNRSESRDQTDSRSKVAATGTPQQLTIITEDAGDSNHIDQDGNPGGYSVLLVKEIMKRLQLNIPIKVVSWSRGYRLALNGPRIVLFSTARTAQREKLFKWAGPLFKKKNTFYSLREFNYPIKTWKDARRLSRIGCTSRDVREQQLRSRGFTNLIATYGENAKLINLSNLLAGRIDLWATGKTEVDTICRKAGVDPGRVKPVVDISTIDGYIAFSRDIPDSTVARWQAALNEIKRDGTYRRIMLRFPTGAASLALYDPSPPR